MARSDAAQKRETGSEFAARPTDDELRAHIETANASVPHVAITFQNLTPQRVRVIAEAQWDPDYEEMSRLVANADAIAVAEMQRLEREKTEGKT